MAVAAADFYTYARATGTPLPKSKQEEAQLAPAVDKWKKSRLVNKFTESKEDYIERNDVGLGEAAGLTAALAGIGAGVVAARNPATRQRIAQILRPTETISQVREKNRQQQKRYDDAITNSITEGIAKLDNVVEEVTPKPGTGVSTDVGGITQDLNVYLSSTPSTPIAKTWPEQRAVQTPKTVTVVPKVTEQPQVTPQQALDDYRQKWINENSTSKQNVSSLQEGIRQEKLARGDREISRGYFESDARRQEQDIARRGFNETDLPPPQDQPAPGAPSPDDPASYNRKYIESSGYVAPKTQNIVSSPNQFSREQLIELNQYASSVADYDGNPDFIRINDKLDDYLGGRTNAYPLTQQDVEKIDNSLTNLKKIDPGAMDRELEVLSSDVGVSLGRKPTEYTRQDINLEDQRLYEIETQGSSNIQQPGIFSDDPELNPKGYKYSSEQGVYQTTPAKEQTFLAQEIQAQPAQPVTLTDVAKADDLVVSQQSIENSNLNLNANANTGVQVGLDPEVSKVASSPINQNTVNTATDTAKAAALIAARRTQLQQAGLTPGTTKFDNALASSWSSKPNVDPNITSKQFRENVVLPKEVEEVVSTKIPESDASNVARNYYNQDTGNIEFATEEGGSPLIRDIYKERVVPSEDVSKAASGGVIRGAARSMDIAEPKERFRIDELTDVKSPDTIGGFVGPSSVEITERATGSDLQYKGPRPAGIQYYNEASPALPLNERAPRTPVRPLIQSETPRIDSYANQGGGAGMGVYGRQSGYVPGPNSKTVTALRSTGLRAKPTDLPETRKGREFNPTTSRDEFRNYSNEALQKRIDTGTYRSGKVSEGAREAQKELNLRKNLEYPINYKPSKETTINSMKVSDDIRRIYNSGRPDAQQLVNEYKANLRNNLGI